MKVQERLSKSETWSEGPIPAGRPGGPRDRPQKVGEVLRAEPIAHAWALVRTAQHGWLPVDPSVGDRHLYENFLKFNDTHVILTEGVNRHLDRVAYDRAVGVNVQVDDTVHVRVKEEQNLSRGRSLAFAGFVAVPILMAAARTFQVVWERRRRTVAK